MNITQAQQQAIRDDAADSAQFDLVSPSGRARCQWTDADLGILKILSGPQRMVGHSFHISTFEDDDGFTVENYEVPRRTVSPMQQAAEALYAKIANEVGRGGSAVQVPLIVVALTIARDEALEEAACLAVNPFSAAVKAYGYDTPKIVAQRIANAIRDLKEAK